MSDLLPPPSTSVPAVQDRNLPPNTMDFTPVWRKWFIDLVDLLNRSGGNEGPVTSERTINTTEPLTGGGNLGADLTLEINNFTNTKRGVVPASGGGTAKFMRADGTWAVPTGSGFSGTVPLAKLTPGGVNGSLVIVNGAITGATLPT